MEGRKNIWMQEVGFRCKCSTEGQLWDNDDEAILSWAVFEKRDERDGKIMTFREKTGRCLFMLLVLYGNINN